jgi:peroxiredoxin
MSQAESVAFGDPAPPIELPDTEGEMHTLPLPGEAPATVVIWTCNHCPYALAWHERLMDVAREYGERGVRFLAINSNDAERYPGDSLEAMRQRVAAGEFSCPYLHDESQEAARAWGPKTTPDGFGLDSDLRLAYRGAPDADYDDPTQGAAWLRGALDALLAGRRPDPAETEPVGCSIKWKR